MSNDIIGERDDNRETDPHSDPKAAATIDPENSINMSKTANSLVLEPVEVK